MLVTLLNVCHKDDQGVLRAVVSQELSLSCGCSMSDTREASLYSIKWYRDDREFFRYIPTGDKRGNAHEQMCWKMPENIVL